MKQHLKQLLFRVSPILATSFFSERSRAHSHRVIKSWGCHRINEVLLERFGDRVVGGPFAGMTLSPMTRSEQLGPYLLGVYELELSSTWEGLFAGSFTQVVDIGAKFGYYAVGLARRFPAARVIAFDTDRWARQALTEMACVNSTPNVQIASYCDPSWLAANLEIGALVVSDCEGFESELFGSAPIPNLATATLVIEAHETIVPGVTRLLKRRLETTHRLEEIWTDPACGDGAIAFDLNGLDHRERSLAVREVRPRQSWIIGYPHEGPNRSLRASP